MTVSKKYSLKTLPVVFKVFLFISVTIQGLGGG